MPTPARSRSASGRGTNVALCRSLLYQALSLGFRPPDEAALRRLTDADAVAALAEAAALIDAERGTDLAPSLRRLPGAARAGDPPGASASYDKLFGHTAHGPVPAYETEYGKDTLFQRPQELSDIAAFFRAFGLVLDPARHERIDHVSCQLEFLAFLARKEAHALECRDEAMRRETVRAARLFLRDHLGRFVPSFCRRAIRTDPNGFYGHLAALCLEFVGSEAASLAVPLGPEALRLQTPLDDGVPMACGGAEACAAGPCAAADEASR
ncbi:MAG: molecular chaperone [Acidobacteriota bacterium]